MLKGKNVVLGVSGGIAAYKACDIVSRLKKRGANVRVIMTRNATEFVTPLTLETLSGNRVATLSFDKDREWETEHIALAKFADVFVVAPASADVIAKFAGGIADDLLSTTILAAKCPKIICPAMNTAMYDDEATQHNFHVLKSRGFVIVEPNVGRLACGDVGKGKLADVQDIVQEITAVLIGKRDYEGKTIAVSAGATRETIDGVRFISNYSSGKMGVEIAKAAAKRGAKVVLIAANVSVEIPQYFEEVVSVQTTQQMLEAATKIIKNCDALIMAAAPADYRVEQIAPNKIKADELTLKLVKNPDIAKSVSTIRGDAKLVIFAAETQAVEEYARKKLANKNADMAVANDVSQEGVGFCCDTNMVTVLKKDGYIKAYDKQSKAAVADIILDELNTLW